MTKIETVSGELNVKESHKEISDRVKFHRKADLEFIPLTKILSSECSSGEMFEKEIWLNINLIVTIEEQND